MSAAGLLLGLINVLIFCAIVVLVAFTLVWLLGIVGYPPSVDMMKWGKIAVALICIGAVVAWLLSLAGGVPYVGPHFLGRL